MAYSLRISCSRGVQGALFEALEEDWGGGSAIEVMIELNREFDLVGRLRTVLPYGEGMHVGFGRAQSNKRGLARKIP